MSDTPQNPSGTPPSPPPPADEPSEAPPAAPVPPPTDEAPPVDDAPPGAGLPPGVERGGNEPPPSGGSGRGFPVVPAVVGVVVLVVVAVVAIVLIGGNDDDDDGGDDTVAAGEEQSPEQVAQGLFESIADGDCAGAAEFLSQELLDADYEGSREAAVEDCEGDITGGNPLESAEVRSAEIVSEEGDTAVVEITAVLNGQEETQPVRLVREDGEWRVAPGADDTTDGTGSDTSAEDGSVTSEGGDDASSSTSETTEAP